MRWILLAFLLVPAIEIGIFVWLGGRFGPLWVVFIILFTGVVGVFLAKYQGMETWNKARESMSHGNVPTNEIIDGICIFVGGVFLFTPGLMTDTIGFLLIIPFTREPFKYIIQNFIKKKLEKGTIIYRK